MRCNRARVLSGVRDELDAPTFRALKAHLRQCPDCAASWIEEDAFRRIVAARPEPKTSAGLTGALLAIPERAVGWEAFRHSLPPHGPILALALSVGLGALGLLYLDPGREAPEPAPAAPQPAFEAGPELRAAAPADRATRVPRLGTRFEDLPQRVDVAPDARSLPESSTALRDPALAASAPGSSTVSDPATPNGPAGPEVEAPESPPAASEEPEERDEPDPVDAAPSPEATKAQLVPSPEPPPTAIPTQPSEWQLTIVAVGGVQPIADGVEVQAEIWSLGGEQERAVDEIRLRFEGGEARRTLRSPLPAPIEVSVYNGTGGLAPCPGEPRVRLVEAAELAAGPVELRVLYCYPPRATTAPSATATRAPATASPPPSATPAPSITPPPTVTPPGSPEPSPPPIEPAPETSPPPAGRQAAPRG